ncbi:cuticle protein 8 [Anopheles stephensi]|uniref:Cuticle protein 19 n=1 Tax=Anopheles stephensi TaxID=30069 RepID=A0A182Y850_ANOST|nr:cuticle protein 8 [Anopheles stephensi]XP_035909178.1 cuticle protein 8 [Anopheles stephensi]XP_035909179.1 cuticle protein 8 [Anopheles stephensi]
MNLFQAVACIWLVVQQLCALLTAGEHLVEFVSNYQQNAEIDYSFRYYIDHPPSGVSFDHWENRKGDHVHGGYGVLEPGGFVRTVHYEVEGDSGFRTVIKTTAPGSSQQYNIHTGGRRTPPPQPLWNTKPVAFVQGGHKS